MHGIPWPQGLKESFGYEAKPEDINLFSRSYIYPTMEELADQINIIMAHYNLKSIIGFGVGAGGNVLARFSMAHPEKIKYQKSITDNVKIIGHPDCMHFEYSIVICSPVFVFNSIGKFDIWSKMPSENVKVSTKTSSQSYAHRLHATWFLSVLPLTRAKLSAYRQACSLEGLESISKSHAPEPQQLQNQQRPLHPPTAPQVIPSSPLMVPVATPPSSPPSKDEPTHWQNTNIHITENPISEAAIC
ncbi:hypothetical protein J437_LFUL000443 [Ladona fulva]|uniref:Uncharacterized protein n=1 Tax=Ladona fulva TaxID=123851 RepID=A0A8K0P190_LADFU|nr:hypothetical protein J437_LFUL000443 [Ladona fulva]